MKINIKATNIELTPAITAYVEKKIGALEKYVHGDYVVQVEVGKTTEHHKSGDIFRAEVHVVGPGLDLYAATDQADLYAAIDIVKDEIADKTLHVKGKRETLTRRGGQLVKNAMKGLNIFKRK